MDNDDALNGSAASPPYGGTLDPTMEPRPSAVGSASVGSGNPQAVLFAWVALFALLVFAHVITLKIQR